MLDNLSVEELFNKMVEDVPTGKEKDASYKNVGAVVEQSTLDRLSAEMSDDELLKQAAVGNYILNTIVEGLIPQLEKWASTSLMEKIAVGTSNAISGYLRESQSNPEQGVDEIMRSEDKMHKDNGKGKVLHYVGGSETSGATVKGGGSMPEGGDGEAHGPVHKLSAAKLVYKIKRAMLEDDLARYQELEAKAKSGQISPEEQAELQELEQKLMALAQQQGGQGAPGGAPPGGDAGGGAPPADAGGGAPAPGGGMGGFEHTGSKMAAVKALLRNYFPEA